MPSALRLEFSDQSDIAHEASLEWLAQVGQQALPEVEAVCNASAPLATLESVEITLVDDATIAQVHVEFMNVPGPTDVITFHHGEVLISVETATRQATEYGRAVRDEIALYVVHGLLHLAGYEDKAPDDFTRMAKLQERILKEALSA